MILLYNIIFYRYIQKYLWFISVWSSTEKMNAYAHRSRKQTKNIIKRIIFNKYTTIKPVTHTAKLIYHKKKLEKMLTSWVCLFFGRVLTYKTTCWQTIQKCSELYKKKSYNYNNPYHNNNFTIIFLFFYFCLSMSSSHTVRLCLYSVYNECDESL